jgi:ATP phosphoribosyltransferase regulatory subunit
MNLDLSAALDRFEQRTGFIAAEGIDPSGIAFAADFGRNLDYYTGFVFELWRAEGGNAKPLAGGGRYDGLLKALGGQDGVPAIGFSMWLDRFEGGGR